MPSDFFVAGPPVIPLTVFLRSSAWLVRPVDSLCFLNPSIFHMQGSFSGVVASTVTIPEIRSEPSIEILADWVFKSARSCLKELLFA